MRFCTYCGAGVNEAMRFCPHCGKALVWENPAQPIEPAQPAEQPVPPVAEPVAEPIVEPVAEPVQEPVQTYIPPVQPVQPAQPVYTYVANPPEEKPKKNTPALLGMLFGFIAVPNVLFSPVFAILSIIFSSIGISKSGKCGKKGLGMAITGLVLGILFLLLYYFIAPLRSAFWQDFYGGMFGDVFGSDLLDEFLYNFDIGGM